MPRAWRLRRSGSCRRSRGSSRRALGWATHTADLTHVCTHLISNTVGSSKYRIAVEKRLPVLRKEWLLDSHAQSSFQPERPYLLPPLHNIMIAISGPTFRGEERVLIEQQVVAQGGKLNVPFSVACTHLVVDAPRGEKYLSCCQRPELAHVKVVSCDWLIGCLREGVCIDEEPFLMPRRQEPCLSSCVIHIWPGSATDEQQHLLSSSARSLGATRVERLGPLVTHVLVGEQGAPDPRALTAALANFGSGALPLTTRWLLECARLQALVAPEAFEWSEREGKENTGPNGLRRSGSSAGGSGGSVVGDGNAWAPVSMIGRDRSGGAEAVGSRLERPAGRHAGRPEGARDRGDNDVVERAGGREEGVRERKNRDGRRDGPRDKGRDAPPGVGRHLRGRRGARSRVEGRRGRRSAGGGRLGARHEGGARASSPAVRC